MKSIEERARETFPESVVRAHRCKAAIRELVADLHAMETGLAEQSALLDEVKRVLGIIVHEETSGCRCDTCRFVRARSQLLTRLGDSHE